MRHTEFWQRMDDALGSSYSRIWADQQVLSELEEQTVSQALESGVAPKQVWRAVWARLELPLNQR